MNKDLKLLIILIIVFILELLFPTLVYKKETMSDIQAVPYQQFLSFEPNEFLYKRNSLAPNGKYTNELSNGYNKGIIPVEIKQIAKNTSAIILVDENEILSHWILKSNYGLYSNNNNPFGIEYEQVKTIFKYFPKNSFTSTTKYIFVDSIQTFQQKYSKDVSFSELQVSFVTYFSLIQSKIIINDKIFNQQQDSLKNILKNIKTFNNTIDTVKLKFYGKDTISVDNKTEIISYSTIDKFIPTKMPNYLLFLVLVLYLFKYKNEKSI